jgi:DNA-binding phage protein
LKQRVSNGEKKTQIAQDLGVSRETLYQYLRGREGANPLHHLMNENQNE